MMSGRWRRTQDILDLVQGRFVVLYRKEEKQENDQEATSQVEGGKLEAMMDFKSNNKLTQPQAIDSTQQILEEAIEKLEHAYGKSCCQLLHVPTLGSVSSTLVRSLSSSLSIKSLEQDTTSRAETENLGRLEDRLKRMVTPEVFDYMQSNRLYGFSD